jgi:hypothetical protein
MNTYGKAPKRSQRRHHNERMKRRAMRIVKERYAYSPKYIKEAIWYWRTYANHLKRCSCTWEGNPRRKFKGNNSIVLTRAEQKDRISVKEQLEEWYIYCSEE